MQPDPIGTSGGINLYAYVGNDPLNLIDPSGNIGFTFSIGALGEIGLSSIFAQGGAQGSLGIAILFDTSNLNFRNPTNIGVSIVTYSAVGSTAGALGSGGPTCTNQNYPEQRSLREALLSVLTLERDYR